MTPDHGITACSLMYTYDSSVHLISLPMRVVGAPITGKSDIPTYPAFDFFAPVQQRVAWHVLTAG